MNSASIYFFSLTPNEGDYGYWWFAGAFTVALRQGECGCQTAEMHVSHPIDIGVCYALFYFVNCLRY